LAVKKFEGGSRPLSTSVNPAGQIYFGDYFSNTERREVHIFGSDDGEKFSVAYTFPGGTIRHVHGLVWDKYRMGFWVLTGDSDSESGLWFTDDGFKTLSAVYTGSQQARAVTIIPVETGLIVPMDSPLEKNWINFISLDDLRVTPLRHIAGSAFFSAQMPGWIFISTVVEPSEVNRCRHACLYASKDGSTWRLIDAIMQDLPSALGFSRYFGYPRIFLPRHANLEQPVLFAGGLCLSASDNMVLRWDLADLDAKWLADMPDPDGG